MKLQWKSIPNIEQKLWKITIQINFFFLKKWLCCTNRWNLQLYFTLMEQIQKHPNLFRATLAIFLDEHGILMSTARQSFSGKTTHAVSPTWSSKTVENSVLVTENWMQMFLADETVLLSFVVYPWRFIQRNKIKFYEKSNWNWWEKSKK